MERSWPLTGRDDELRAVAAAARAGAGIVVAGRAGVGKTRLVREALTARRERGVDVVWAQGSSAARPVPLGAFAGMLDLPAGDGADVVGAALDQLAARPDPVLVVDDAHLLDEHSAIVLHRAVVRGTARAVVTVRAGEPCPDLVTALWKDEHLRRLDLAPLDAERTTGLVAQVLGGPVESASAHRLWTLTEGSPLFLRHLLTGEVASGRLTPASGLWRWTSDPALTPELGDLLEQQIGALTAEVRDVVDLVALAEPVAVGTLAALTSSAALEQAEERDLVRVDGDVVRLAHPLYGEVRRAAMGSLRARRLRGQVARSLDLAADAIPRAVLTLDSDLPSDPVLFLTAAQSAIGLYDLPLAERLARAASAGGHPGARLVHAAALSWLSRGREAETTLLELAPDAPDAGTLAMVHLHRAGNLLWTLADAAGSRAALDTARATGGLPTHVAAMSLALTAADADVETVLQEGPELLRAGLPDELAAILVSTAVTAAAAVAGDHDLLDEAATVGGLTDDRVPTVIPGFGLVDLQVLGHRLAGTTSRGEHQAALMRAASADLPGPARLMGLVVAGHAALGRGRLREAVSHLREAWAGFAGTGHEFGARCRTLLTIAAAQAGAVARSDPPPPDLADQHPAWRIHTADDLLARAWRAAAEGAVTEALEHVAAAATWAGEVGAPAHEVLAWQTAVQLGDASAALPRLAELRTLTPRAAVAHDHARAWADGDGPVLLEAAHAWDRLGDLVAAGDAAAQAADVHRRDGRQGSSLTAAAVAEKLAARSGARTPALATASRPLPLTAREREIAVLAARGLTNRAIAERLTVSVRTVEGHLYRAGLKLGVSERAALAEVLGVE